MKGKQKKCIVLVLLAACLCVVFFSMHVVSQKNSNVSKAETFADHLGRSIEEDFMDIDGLESAHAEVNYDKKTGEYSLELSLTADREISGEQMELYKKAMNKTFENVVIIVNGEIIE